MYLIIVIIIINALYTLQSCIAVRWYQYKYLLELCGRELGIHTMYYTLTHTLEHAQGRSSLDLNMRGIPNSPYQTPQASGYLSQTCKFFERKCFHHINQMHNINLSHNPLDIQVRPYLRAT